MTNPYAAVDWTIQRNGCDVDMPINWNEIIDWHDELGERERGELPFAETDRMYQEIPDDTIWSPNTEHHGFSDSHIHVNAVGSTFKSGIFDSQNRFKTMDHGFKAGYAGPWRQGFDAMLDQLAHADGGGITINHPTWFTRLSDEAFLRNAGLRSSSDGD
jgi:hypothetical protein